MLDPRLLHLMHLHNTTMDYKPSCTPSDTEEMDINLTQHYNTHNAPDDLDTTLPRLTSAEKVTLSLLRNNSLTLYVCTFSTCFCGLFWFWLIFGPSDFWLFALPWMYYLAYRLNSACFHDLNPARHFWIPLLVFFLLVDKLNTHLCSPATPWLKLASHCYLFWWQLLTHICILPALQKFSWL